MNGHAHACALADAHADADACDDVDSYVLARFTRRHGSQVVDQTR
jgi:hypothetical protein